MEPTRGRLRPIVMTTVCFIPMVPPYFALGAGAEMRCSVRTAMRWGAFSVSLFSIFLTPVFFYLLRSFVGSADSQVGIKRLIEGLGPGRYHVDEISSDPLPSGRTSRRWGVGIKRPDGPVTLDPDPWQS